MPLDRRLCSQPLMVTVFADVLRDVFDVDVHAACLSRSGLDVATGATLVVASIVSPMRSRGATRAAEHVARVAGAARPPRTSARRRSRSSERRERAAQSIVPSNGTRCSSVAAAVVVHVRRHEVPGQRLDRLDEVAHQVRVAEVEADADVEAARGRSSSSCTSGAGARQLVRDDFDGEPHAERRRRSRRAPRCSARAARLVVGRRAGCWLARTPRCSDETPAPECAGDVAARARVSATRRAPSRLVGARDRAQGPTQRAACVPRRRSARACMQARAPRRPATAADRDRRRVVVVEMRARREHLDGVEAVRGDLDEVVAAQPLAVEEVRRDPELTFRHGRRRHVI